MPISVESATRKGSVDDLIASLKPDERNMILGVFDCGNFDHIQQMAWPRLTSFGGFADWVVPDNRGMSVVMTVRAAAKQASKIVFVLDEVYFPINPGLSITCNELDMICREPDLFEKTVFVKGKNVIDFDKNLVL